MTSGGSTVPAFCNMEGPAITLESIVALLIELNSRNQQWNPAVVLDGSYSGYAYSRPDSRWSHFKTINYSMEDRSRFRSFDGYCSCLEITPEDLVGGKLFNIVSHPTDFKHKWPLPLPDSDGTQHFILAPNHNPDTWRAWKNVGVGLRRPDQGPWDDPWEDHTPTEDEVYTILCGFTLSWIPEWIARTYGNYEQFAEQALRLIPEESTELWRTFRCGDFRSLYGKRLAMHVFTLDKLIRGEPLTGSSSILIAEGIDQRPLHERMASVVARIRAKQ